MSTIPLYRKTGYPVGTWSQEHPNAPVTILFDGVVVTRRHFWDADRAKRYIAKRHLTREKPVDNRPDRFAHLECA